MNSNEKFENWFAGPLRTLSTLKDGDGAFIAFGVALALYERFIKAGLKKAGAKGSTENFRQAAAKDLGIDVRAFSIWWEIFRDGINHQASPKKVRKEGVDYTWRLSGSYPPVPALDGDCFKVNPWGFVDLIVDKYRHDATALDETETYSLGDIGFELE